MNKEFNGTSPIADSCPNTQGEAEASAYRRDEISDDALALWASAAEHGCAHSLLSSSMAGTSTEAPS